MWRCIVDDESDHGAAVRNARKRAIEDAIGNCDRFLIGADEFRIEPADGPHGRPARVNPA
jgi:hypothetical protein